MLSNVVPVLIFFGVLFVVIPGICGIVVAHRERNLPEEERVRRSVRRTLRARGYPF